jgi:hypothetical protein
MKILLGDLNTEVGTEDTIEPTIWNENLHEICNDNDIRVLKCATSKNLSRMQCSHIVTLSNKCNCLSLHGKVYNQTDHVLIGKRHHSNIVDARSFRGADCDTNYYVMLADVRQGLSVSKRAEKKYDMEKFNLRS